MSSPGGPPAADGLIVHERSTVVWDATVIERYREIAPATIGHLTEDGFLDIEIKPLGRKVKLVGPALTVYQTVHYSALPRAIELAQPGEVLVIDRGGERKRANFGEMLAWRCLQAGIAGLVIDGPVTDVVEIQEMGLPVFSRGISALLGPVLARQGVINGTITCGGVAVHPGDLVLGDDNGVVIIRPSLAPALLQKAEAQQAEEALRRASMKDRRSAP